MISRLHLTLIVLLVGAAWLVLLVINGVAVELRWLESLTTVVPVLLVLLGVFDKWLWKSPWLTGWFTNRPVLCGTWQVELQTKWVDPRTGSSPGPIACYMAVRQTFSSLSMRLMTPESASKLIAPNIERDDGVFRVAGIYVNEPSLTQRGEDSDKRSEIHYGALLLNVQGRPVAALEGRYWTDRCTMGTMRFRARKEKVFENFEEAHAAFGAVPASEPTVPQSA